MISPSQILIGFFSIGFLLISSNIGMGQDYGQTINVAGRQRMLSQKMTKEYLLVVSGNNVDENKESMNKTMDLFSESLKDLLGGSSDKNILEAPVEIKAKLEAIGKMWVDFKSLLTNSGFKKEAASLAQINQASVALLKEMHACVGMYEKVAGSNNNDSKGRVVNIAGRQRMLSQRIAKEALLIALDVEKEKSLADLKASTELFSKCIKGLIEGSEELNLPKTEDKTILKQMKKVKRQWRGLSVALNEILSGKEIIPNHIEVIRKQSLAVLKDMNKAVGMYAKM